MESGGKTTITWYGHACVEVVTPGGVVILFDPWFANPKSTKAPEDVARCDVMLVSHGHSDHMGNALPTYSENGYGYAVEKAPSTKGWTYPVF